MRRYARSREDGSNPDEVTSSIYTIIQPQFSHRFDSASNRNEHQGSTWGVKNGRRARLTSPPPVSRLSRKCRSLDISQPYGLQWPVTDVAFIFTPKTCNCTLFLLPAGTDVLQYDGTSDRQFRKDKLCRLFAKQENIFKKFCLEDNAKAASLT